MKPTLNSAIVIALLFICQFAGAQQNNRTIFLVRHAEPSSSAPVASLSASGEKRAQCLAQTLADSGIQQIYVSDSKRAQQTAAPLAAQLKLKPSEIGTKDISKTVRNLLYGGNGNTLFVANGDMLPLIVQRLQAGKVSAIADSEFDRLFVISVTDGSSAPAATLRYCEAGVSGGAATVKHVSLPVAGRKP
jgi:histidine phosphatase superfamily protein (branch 1)